MDNSVLRQLQLTELEILKAFHKFCMENDILYSLYAGTALGAVRHGGFIPWDDDVDLVMTRVEYEKFIKCWKEKPVQGYYLQCFETEPDITITHTKIRKNNTLFLQEGEQLDGKHHGVWIDIFVWDKVKNTSRGKLWIYWNAVKRILLTRCNQRNAQDSFSKRMIRGIVGILPEHIRKKLYQNAEKNITRYKKLQENYFELSLSTIPTLKYKISADISKKYMLINFEGEDFMIFKEYHKMLTLFFGDYMQLPDEQERVCKHKPVMIEL